MAFFSNTGNVAFDEAFDYFFYKEMLREDLQEIVEEMKMNGATIDDIYDYIANPTEDEYNMVERLLG